jgi:hypothetical protein
MGACVSLPVAAGSLQNQSFESQLQGPFTIQIMPLGSGGVPMMKRSACEKLFCYQESFLLPRKCFVFFKLLQRSHYLKNTTK